MLRRQQRLLARALRRAKSSAAAAVDGVAAALTRVTVHTTELQLGWSDGTEGRFHTLWLRDNCESNRHASSRQKLRGAASLPSEVAVDRVAWDDHALRVTWTPETSKSDSTEERMGADQSTHGQNKGQNNGQNKDEEAEGAAHSAGGPPQLTSHFCARWLHEHAQIHERAPRRRAHAHRAAARAAAADSPPRVRRLSYASLSVEGEGAGLWPLLRAVAQDGAALVEGVPTQSGTVCELARRVGPLQPNIYGDMFNVISTKSPINVAYSLEGIPPHMDLCYYESPPGLQLLHCLNFDSRVRGGDSFLIDGYAPHS